MEDKQSDSGTGEDASTSESNFVAFSGEGNRLDGKNRPMPVRQLGSNRSAPKKGIPDYEFQLGTLRFIRIAKAKEQQANGEQKEQGFQAFRGEGRSLVKK